MKLCQSMLAHLHYQLATAASARLQDAQQQLHGDGRPDASSVLAGAGASSAASPPADKTATPPEPPATVIARCRAQAAKHYTLAADVLSKRLERAETGSAESEDLTELLGDVRAKADEHKQADAPAGAGGLGGKATVRGEASSASVTTIGFGAPVATAAGVTTIGFGGTSGGASGSGSSSSFAAPTGSMPVTCLGVVGGSSGKKRAVLVPNNGSSALAPSVPAACPAAVPAVADASEQQPDPKRIRLEPSATSAP